MEKNLSITSVSLAGNLLSPQFCLELIGATLFRSKSFALDISSMFLSLAANESITKSLCRVECRLGELYLSDCGIEDEGLALLSIGISETSSLYTFVAFRFSSHCSSSVSLGVSI